MNKRNLLSITFAALVASALTGGAKAQDAKSSGYADVNGMKMYYEVSGRGEPLIVLHGAYMNIPAMGSIIGKLAATHKIYALEFQGHGRTTDIDRPITYPNLVS
jgi:pimeloyl-ACP methyl ester carboxylesterase